MKDAIDSLDSLFVVQTAAGASCPRPSCPEALRRDDEASKLRSVLAKLIDCLPADHPLRDEALAALN